MADQLSDRDDDTPHLDVEHVVPSHPISPPSVGSGRFATKIFGLATCLLTFVVARCFTITIDETSGIPNVGSTWSILTSLDFGSYSTVVIGSVFAQPQAAVAATSIAAWFLFRSETPYYFYDSRWAIRQPTGLLLLVCGLGVWFLLITSGLGSIIAVVEVALMIVGTKYTMRLEPTTYRGQRAARKRYRQHTDEVRTSMVKIPREAVLRSRLRGHFSRADFPETTRPMVHQMDEVREITEDLKFYSTRSVEDYRKIRSLLKLGRDTPTDSLLDPRVKTLTKLINDARNMDFTVKTLRRERTRILSGKKNSRWKANLQIAYYWATSRIVGGAQPLLFTIMAISTIAVVANPVPWVPEQCFTLIARQKISGYLMSDNGSVIVLLSREPRAAKAVPSETVVEIQDGACE